MGVPNVVYKWKSLRTLHVIVFVMNVTGCVIVVIMIVSAVKLRMGIGQYLDLVVAGDANFWPGMMFLIAFLCAPIYAIGIRLCFHLRFFVPDSQSVPRLNQVLFIHCALSFASVIVIIGIITVGILHMVNFHRINQNGIIESMQDYATDLISKVRVDMIQINFKCCGSRSFKDWFHLRWMQKEGEAPEGKGSNESAVLSTDVPFSCCSTGLLRPCVHHDILKPSEVYLYQPEHRLTIATTGCHAKVLSHARYVGGMLIVALILLAAYQMVLALLSRLLQTAHSNALYIGPKKDRYVSWILGSMPSADMYDRLIFGEEKVPRVIPPLQETAAIRASSQTKDSKDFNVKLRASDNRVKKSFGKRYSKTSNVERPSSTTVTSHEGGNKPSTTTAVRRDTSKSRTDSTNSIPTPPPSPGTEDKSVPSEKTRGASKPTKGPRKCIKMKRLPREIPPKENRSKLKELRESMQYLEKYQSPWRGGSPIFETTKSSALVNGGVKSGMDLAKKSEELERLESSSTSSSDYKKYKVRNKDSAEDEMRMKKFCKDLSSEYKKSPYSKQRRDFSEQYKRQDPTHQPLLRDTDEGRTIRNEVYARFNPADTYSRFRGSVQDTVMRRGSQTQPGPPPIPISDQRTVTLNTRCRRPRCENSSYPHHPLEYGQPAPRPHVHIGGPSWPQHQRQGRSTRYPFVPTYFPISSRPPRPPRLPPRLDQSCGVGPLQFTQNRELSGFHPQRCPGRCVPGMQPPRFLGC